MERDPYKKTLSENLKSIRKSKGLTTVELAQILGVSQAKISYIEHCKGVLSARDVAVLSRRLNVPVADFFRGLDEPEDQSGAKELINQLAHYGAVLLAKPPGITLKAIPFEEVFAQSLGFIEDDRLHKGFCAALITQAASKEINVDRLFAIIGDNPFLISKAAEESQICLKIIDLLNDKIKQVSPRSKQQIQKIVAIAGELTAISKSTNNRAPSPEELLDFAEFVADCLNVEK